MLRGSNIEHRTINIQHRTPEVNVRLGLFDVGFSMFDVQFHVGIGGTPLGGMSGLNWFKLVNEGQPFASEFEALGEEVVTAEAKEVGAEFVKAGPVGARIVMIGMKGLSWSRMFWGRRAILPVRVMSVERGA